MQKTLERYKADVQKALENSADWRAFRREHRRILRQYRNEVRSRHSAMSYLAHADAIHAAFERAYIEVTAEYWDEHLDGCQIRMRG